MQTEIRKLLNGWPSSGSCTLSQGAIRFPKLSKSGGYGVQHHRTRHNLLVISVVLMGILAGIAFAKKEPKTYPEEGKVIGLGTNGHTADNHGMFSMNKTVTKYSHTYKIQTEKEVLELDCGKIPFYSNSKTGDECGGDKPIKIGDVLHFRIENGWAYIPVTEAADQGKQSEQKLRVLSESPAETAKESPAAPLAQAAESNVTKLSIASTPEGADIEVDGGFVGNTPSTIDLTSGDHTVTVSKNGFKAWERKIKASGGNVNLNADLEAVGK